MSAHDEDEEEAKPSWYPGPTKRAKAWGRPKPQKKRKRAKPGQKRHPGRKLAKRDARPTEGVEVRSPNDPSWWRKPWHPAFLEVLRKNGCNPAAAADELGMPRSTVQTARKTCAKFRQAWDDVVEGTVDELEATWLDRAKNGWREPVFYQGELVGWKRKYDTRLFLAFMAAKRPEEWRARPIESVPTIDAATMAADLREAMLAMAESTPLVALDAAEDLAEELGEVPAPEGDAPDVDEAVEREPEYEVLKPEVDPGEGLGEVG